MRKHISLLVRILLVASFVALFGNTSQDAKYNTQSTTIFSRDSAYLDTFIPAQMDSLNIPGLTACVIKNGQIIWTGAYGYANFAQSIEAQDTTLFMLASISKTITGTAIMQLWEQYSFDLEDSINDYLPFSVIHPLYPDSVITFRMLMTHTSGIIDDWNIIAQSFCWGGDSPMQLDTFLYNYLTPGGYYYSPTNFSTWPPGHGYSYCNVATALVGYLLEAIADSFPIYCSDSIFTPLEMNETSWFLADLDTSNVAIPYQYTGGQYVPYGYWGHPMYPAFQLRTSTLQLARFLTAFMQYGEIDTVRILDSTTVELMTTIQDTLVAPEQGLLWQNYSLYSRDLWGHAGSTLGVRTQMWYHRDENSGVIILTNGEPDSLTTILHELFEFAAQHGIVEHESATTAKISLEVSPNPFRQFTDIRYQISDSGYKTADAKVEIKIFDATGRMVKSFRITPYALRSSVSWEGQDDQNRMLAGGVYFVALQYGDYKESTKLLLIR